MGTGTVVPLKKVDQGSCTRWARQSAWSGCGSPAQLICIFLSRTWPPCICFQA